MTDELKKKYNIQEVGTEKFLDKECGTTEHGYKGTLYVLKKIEEALPDYLFDISQYPTPDFSKKMFFGKSPKHKGFKAKYASEGYVPQSK